MIQILFWGGLWVLIPMLWSGDWDHFDMFLVRSLIMFLGILAVVWVNMEVLLPRYFFSQKQGLYVALGLGMVLAIILLIEWDGAPWGEYFYRASNRGKGGGRQEMSPFRVMKILGGAMPYFTAFIGSALFEIARFAKQKEKEAADYRSEKLEAEMKFLKSQFNPHFLFNALNNVYTLTVIKSDKAPDNLLKLSGMLRYMLYDCKADTVPLGKEIEYLRHFIDLHLLKDSRGLNVRIDLDESRPDLKIAPMLLIPFVENAFKHSRIEDLENGWISISLKTSAKEVVFEVKNSLPKAGFTKDKVGGIGLENVKRQLELLYPGHHELKIGKQQDAFEVYLRIEMSAS
ncbi:MAG: histidine kinase [Saprospiraceae bacterium]